MHLKAKNDGAALLIVLMISACLAAIMMFFSTQGQLTNNYTEILKNRSNVELEVHSIQSELVFELITTPLSVLGPTSSSGEQFTDSTFFDNINGKPFKYQDYDIVVQDLFGVVSLMPFDEKRFRQLILRETTPENLQTIMDRLDDWQDKDDLVRLEGAEKGDYEQPFLPANKTIQSKQELRYILGDDSLFEKVAGNLVMYGSPYLVRQFAPSNLYSVLGFSNNSDTSGSAESGNERVYPSGRFKIKILSRTNSNYAKQFVFYRGVGSIRPYFISNEKLVF
ncbi:type II secretion system protein GspK [Pseudoalteromonas sp. Of11M-6]|uniref:type II secretion system protein GspK n=1 Tax=Pseudoalteromonas sp. Of11M-6 TaxID=2917754 RepID=UPI001EF460BE|nr:type II secretion system protein GspK [Pseudoalteromonas sp. Of11M-6]MCG7551811.1 type II secretion system protein GspK [Pseudoalteromonas sp. Of11M-6]